MTELTEHQMAIKEAQHKGWMIGYTEAWNNARNGDLPDHPPLDDAGNPWRPAIEEPTEFGSLVRATCGPGLVGLLWQKCPERGKHYWESETGAVDVWSELTDVEVLRVGVGGASKPTPVEQLVGVLSDPNWKPERADVAPEETEDYKAGVSDVTFNILTKLRVLRAEAITSERKNAYDVAIKTVEGLQP